MEYTIVLKMLLFYHRIEEDCIYYSQFWIESYNTNQDITMFVH